MPADVNSATVGITWQPKVFPNVANLLTNDDVVNCNGNDKMNIDVDEDSVKHAVCAAAGTYNNIHTTHFNTQWLQHQQPQATT